MQESVSMDHIHSMLNQMKPFLELAFDVTGSLQNRLLEEIETLKLSNKEMIMKNDNIIKSNDHTIVALEEQNAILRLQLETTKSEKQQAQYRHLAYDVATHIERVFAVENDSHPVTLYDGCFKYQTYDLAATEKAFDIVPVVPDGTHRQLNVLLLAIKRVKEQCCSSCKSTPDAQQDTKLSEMTGILEWHFDLSYLQRTLFDKLVTYGVGLINAERKDRGQVLLTKENLTVADILSLQDY